MEKSLKDRENNSKYILLVICKFMRSKCMILVQEEFGKFHRRIQNPVKYAKWRVFFAKISSISMVGIILKTLLKHCTKS